MSKLRLENVCYKYEGSKKLVLRISPTSSKKETFMPSLENPVQGKQHFYLCFQDLPNRLPELFIWMERIQRKRICTLTVVRM